MSAATTRYLVMAMRRPDFDPAAVAPHLAFIDALRERGLLEMTGGFADNSGGAYVIRAASLEEARRLVQDDPLVTRGVSDVTVHEWRLR